MDSISKQHNDIFDEADFMLAMNPSLSLDEVKAALQHTLEHHNDQPLADFCGLTPNQMANWLNAPLDELQGVIITTPADLSSCPVMRYLALILDYITSFPPKITPLF